jgi:cytochrome c
VRAILHMRGSYRVMTADGKSVNFPESDLRLKVDSSALGPLFDKPVLMPAGMQGDRASVFFASPEEISTFIKHQC